MSALGLSQIISGSWLTDSALKSGVAGSPYQFDYKTFGKIIKDPDLFKIQSKEEGVQGKKKEKAAKLSYDTVKTLGFKGSYKTLLKKLGLVERPSFTFPGFGSGIDIH